MCYVIKAVAFVRYKLLRRQCDFEKARSNHERNLWSHGEVPEYLLTAEQFQKYPAFKVTFTSHNASGCIDNFYTCGHPMTAFRTFVCAVGAPTIFNLSPWKPVCSPH